MYRIKDVSMTLSALSRGISSAPSPLCTQPVTGCLSLPNLMTPGTERGRLRWVSRCAGVACSPWWSLLLSLDGTRRETRLGYAQQPASQGTRRDEKNTSTGTGTVPYLHIPPLSCVASSSLSLSLLLASRSKLTSCRHSRPSNKTDRQI